MKILRNYCRLQIDVIGFSSDGDTRLLSAMRSQMQLNDKILFDDVLHIASYVQDTIHKVLKLRNKLLKISVHLPMGNKQVSVTHLKLLINNTSKDVHGLVLKDICPDDRQNFRSLEKTMESRVLQALNAKVPDSQATIMYLKLCSYIESAMDDLEMIPIERIRRLWFVVFFLRIWRKWIINSSKNRNSTTKYTLKDNWITANAYQCIEINCHSIIHVMRKMREAGEDDLFLPFLFNSQTCEQSFRQLRSMTSMNWTKINFSILELSHMIGRLELQNDIIYFKLADVDIEFPRIARKSGKFKHHPLPSDQEIKSVVEQAKKQAIAEALKFEMAVPPNDNIDCNLPNVNIDVDEMMSGESESDSEYEMHNDDPFRFDENDDVELSEILQQNLCLRDYSNAVEDCEDVDERSRFTKVTDKSGATKIVRKSAVVWLLSNSNKETLSSDRLQRVQGSSRKTCRRRLDFNSQTQPFVGRIVFRSDDLCLGQWSFFKYPFNPKRSRSTDLSSYLVGAVTSFKYSTGKTDKEKQYSWEFAAVTNGNIQVLATWYKIQPSGEFASFKNYNSFYVPMSNYLMSMQSPIFDSDNETGTCRIYLHSAVNTIIRDHFIKILNSIPTNN